MLRSVFIKVLLKNKLSPSEDGVKPFDSVFSPERKDFVFPI
jgi:hypothetical protein